MLNIHSESCLLYTIVIVSVPSRLFASTVPASTKNWGTTGKNINEVVENSQQQIDYIYSYIKFSTRTTGERRQLYQFMFLLPFRKAEWKSCEWTQYYKRVSGWERETKCQQYIIEECQSGWKRVALAFFESHTHCERDAEGTREATRVSVVECEGAHDTKFYTIYVGLWVYILYMKSIVGYDPSS